MRTAVGALGRTLITLGLLILLFVAYQLWGTGFYTDREQSRLKDDFEAELEDAPTTTTAAGVPATAPVSPPEGEAVAIIQIPKIGVDSAVIEGVSVPDLRKGPGHYPDTPLPGQAGNAAIAGHRTTYGAPFGDLGELAPGDEIKVRTRTGEYRYLVADSSPFVVQPTQIEVLEPILTANGVTEATLTLTTCEPKYSAAQRLIVQAKLAPDEVALPPPSDPAPVVQLDTGLSGEGQSRLPTLVWGFVLAVVGGLWWWLFHRYRRWTTWFAGVIPFLVVLFVFFFYLERMLPANY